MLGSHARSGRSQLNDSLWHDFDEVCGIVIILYVYCSVTSLSVED